MGWGKDIALWFEHGTAFISIPFTWLLPKAYSLCISLGLEGFKVRAGGPAVLLMPDYLSQVAKLGGEVEALSHHNSDATFTTRGCIRRCEFCAVPKIEGEFRELQEWQPKPIICDNNFLASSRRHFDNVIDSLKAVRGVDFNQGLDARLITLHHAERLTELHLHMVRLSWDFVGEESAIRRAIEILTGAGIPKSKISVFCLIGFNDSPEDALYRLNSLKSWGITPFAMRFQPLDSLAKNSHVAFNWTERQLRDFMRYWNRQQVGFGAISFEQYLHAVL